MEQVTKFSDSQMSLGQLIISMSRENYILVDVYDSGLHWITNWEKS